jgi:hypothetical protein
MDNLNMFSIDNDNSCTGNNSADPVLSVGNIPISVEDLVFITIIGIIVLIIGFSNKPMIGPAIDSVTFSIKNNAVTDYVMSSVSSTYVIKKKDMMLTKALSKLSLEMSLKPGLMNLMKTIDHNVNKAIKEREKDKSNIQQIWKEICHDTGQRSDSFYSIIAYSIVNRLRKLGKLHKSKNNIRQYDPTDLSAIELLHSAQIIADRQIKIKSNDNTPYVVGSAQLTLMAFGLIADVDYRTRQYAVENIVKIITDKGKDKDDTASMKNADFMHNYSILSAASRDTSDYLSRLVTDPDDMNLTDSTRDEILRAIGKKSSPIQGIGFELAWVIGGAPITSEYMEFIRKMSDDFGLGYRMYMDFKNYYSDQLDPADKNSNIAITMGLDDAYNEFTYRLSEFANKCTHMKIMTSDIKYIMTVMTDSVSLAYGFISDNSKKNGSKKYVNDADTDDEGTDDTDNEEEDDDGEDDGTDDGTDYTD